MHGLPATGTIGLGWLEVRGRSRVPSPPAITTAFTLVAGSLRRAAELAAGRRGCIAHVAARRTREADVEKGLLHARPTPSSADPDGAHRGQTAMRPSQLMCRSSPRRRAPSTSTSITTSRADQHGQRPARQQLEVPHDGHAHDHHQPVDERVHQRAQAAVLAGDAGDDPVEVVGPRRRSRSRSSTSGSRPSSDETARRTTNDAEQARSARSRSGSAA